MVKLFSMIALLSAAIWASPADAQDRWKPAASHRPPSSVSADHESDPRTKAWFERTIRHFLDELDPSDLASNILRR